METYFHAADTIFQANGTKMLGSLQFIRLALSRYYSCRQMAPAEQTGQQLIPLEGTIAGNVFLGM
jgi:hypothetical protein